LHHAHLLDDYLNDFPNSKIIIMTRDPRANFVSGIIHWREFESKTDNGHHLFRYIGRILSDARVMAKYNNEYLVVRVEHLGDEKMLKKLANWLNIHYTDTMKLSTWGGLIWNGDRLSKRKREGMGFCEDLLQNDWEAILSRKDKYILNFIMNNRLKYYGYSQREINSFSIIIVPILIVLPLKFEWRFLSYKYIRKCFQDGDFVTMAVNMVSYFRRVKLFFHYYFKILKNEDFSPPLLKTDM